MDKSLALLIDAENISSKYITTIIDEANKVGKLNYRRVYGDWTTNLLNGWKEACAVHGLTPVQQFSPVSGKSSSDFTLVIDAMDILFSRKVDGFCICSSDSDFTKLITRLKEDNMLLLGMGEEKTPINLVSSYDDFLYLDKFGVEEKEEATPEKKEVKKTTTKKKKTSITPLKEINRTLHNFIDEEADEEGWAYWGQVAEQLKKKYPGFHPRNYGKNKRDITFFLENKVIEKKTVNTSLYVRSKK